MKSRDTESDQQPTNAAESTTLEVDIRRVLLLVFVFCLCIELGFVLLDLTVNWNRWSGSRAIRRMFNITREDGMASWFAVTQTFMLALFCWMTYAVVRKQPVTSLRRGGWLFLALLFTYMAVDDGAAVHERVGTALKHVEFISAFPSYAWQIIFVPFFAMSGLFVLVFLWREAPTVEFRLLTLFAIGCFGFAVVLDFIEGLDDGYRWLEANLDWRVKTVRHFSKSLEEFCEMLGITVLIIYVLGYLPSITRAATVEFR